MRVEIIDSVRGLTELRANWDAVYDADPEAQFFLSWTWMSKWLAILDKPWFILAARPDGESSAYAAFLPLWLKTEERKSGGFQTEITLGGKPFADYAGFLCMPEAQEQAIPAFARQVKQLDWSNLHLTDFCASEQRAALFMQEFSDSKFGVAELDPLDKDRIDFGICPFAQLPGDWDAYLDGRLSANTRQKIRRLLRQIEGSEEFRITHAERHTAERDIETLLRFWGERWGAHRGERLPGLLRTNRTMLRHAFDTGSLFLPVLWQGERPVGALAILVDASKRSFLFFMGGRDQTYDGPPPGIVLHAHSIRHAIRSRFVTYDFLRGSEPYKYSFGVEERRIKSLVITTMERGDLWKVAGAYCEIIERQPKVAVAYYALGHILLELGQFDYALAAFDVTAHLQPDFPDIHVSLLKALHDRGEALPADLARQVSLHAEACARVGKLSAIAAASNRNWQATTRTLAVAKERTGVKPAFQSPTMPHDWSTALKE